MSIAANRSLEHLLFYELFHSKWFVKDIQIVIWIWNKELYLIHSIPGFHRWIMRARFLNNWKAYFSGPWTLWKLFFYNTILKSAKFWTKWGVAAFFTTFPWQITHITKHKKMHYFVDFQRLFDKIHFFSCFVMRITCQGKALKDAATPHLFIILRSLKWHYQKIIYIECSRTRKICFSVF